MMARMAVHLAQNALWNDFISLIMSVDVAAMWFICCRVLGDHCKMLVIQDMALSYIARGSSL